MSLRHASSSTRQSDHWRKEKDQLACLKASSTNLLNKDIPYYSGVYLAENSRSRKIKYDLKAHEFKFQTDIKDLIEL